MRRSPPVTLLAESRVGVRRVLFAPRRKLTLDERSGDLLVELASRGVGASTLVKHVVDRTHLEPRLLGERSRSNLPEDGEDDVSNDRLATRSSSGTRPARTLHRSAAPRALK